MPVKCDVILERDGVKEITMNNAIHSNWIVFCRAGMLRLVSLFVASIIFFTAALPLAVPASAQSVLVGQVSAQAPPPAPPVVTTPPPAGTGPGPISSVGAGGCNGNGIGAVMCNINKSSTGLPIFLGGLCYLFGIYLGIRAIWLLKEHVATGGQVPIWDSLKRFAAGGGMFALPYVASAAYATMAGGSGFFPGIIDHAETQFNNNGAGGGGLDAMMIALMRDIWVPVHNLMAAFAYMAGLILIVIGISRLLKSAQDGPKGPAGFGTIMTFLTAGALLSVDSMMGAFSSSLFLSPTVATFAELSYTDGMTAEEVGHVHAVISSVLAFVMVLGWISFIRGWFIIRDVAEGDHQASLMAGITHLIGGALAVNLGPVMNAVQNTFGLAGYGVVFS
jgi:hypothetical protein